jgi:dTDP-4-dehydrorhamnose 3,5-epimerase
MPFEFKHLKIPDLILIEPKIFHDERGFFLEAYKSSDFRRNGINVDFVQDNLAKSDRGVLRGLHYQLPPMAQGKLVSVIKGKVWDVAVDIRKSSPTFLQWEGVELSAENSCIFYVPPGFAHGYLTLAEDTLFSYKCTNEYSPEHERGIIWDDPEIGIQWPCDNPMVSERDQGLGPLSETQIFN